MYSVPSPFCFLAKGVFSTALGSSLAKALFNIFHPTQLWLSCRRAGLRAGSAGEPADRPRVRGGAEVSPPRLLPHTGTPRGYQVQALVKSLFTGERWREGRRGEREGEGARRWRKDESARIGMKGEGARVEEKKKRWQVRTRIGR